LIDVPSAVMLISQFWVKIFGSAGDADFGGLNNSKYGENYELN